MRFVKVLASIVFSLIIIIALVGYFAVRNFDLNKYKSFATEMVEQQTGAIWRLTVMHASGFL